MAHDALAREARGAVDADVDGPAAGVALLSGEGHGAWVKCGQTRPTDESPGCIQKELKGGKASAIYNTNSSRIPTRN